jgi:hypothetical protein
MEFILTANRVNDFSRINSKAICPEIYAGGDFRSDLAWKTISEHFYGTVWPGKLFRSTFTKPFGLEKHSGALLRNRLAWKNVSEHFYGTVWLGKTFRSTFTEPFGLEKRFGALLRNRLAWKNVSEHFSDIK